MIYIHLHQINTTDNPVNGNGSTLLTSIGLRCNFYGGIDTVNISNPAYKRLTSGTLRELKNYN